MTQPIKRYPNYAGGIPSVVASQSKGRKSELIILKAKPGMHACCARLEEEGSENQIFVLPPIVESSTAQYPNEFLSHLIGPFQFFHARSEEREHCMCIAISNVQEENGPSAVRMESS